MFGLVRKSRLKAACERLCNEYDKPIPPKEHRVPGIDTNEYYWGNMNAVNYIAHQCGVRLEREKRGRT